MTVLKFKNVRHRDAVLAPATPDELVSYMASRAKLDPGKIWDGYFKPLLEAMDKATRDKVLANLDDDYGNELGTSKAEEETEAKGLTFGGENQDEKEDEETNPDGSIGKGKPNSTEDNIGCNSKGGRVLRGWRDKDSSAIDAINKANEAFWKK